MVKTILLVLFVLVLFSVGVSYSYAETLSDDYEFVKVLAYDRNSPDGRITPGTREIDLGLVIRNKSTSYPLKFTSLDFYLSRDLENVKTMSWRNNYNPSESPTDRKVETVVGQCQNFSLSAKGVGIAVCATIALTGALEPGQYVIRGQLRNSTPNGTAPWGVQFNPDIQLETIMTVYDSNAGEQPNAVLAAVNDVNTNVMNTQSIINERMNKHEANFKSWGNQIYSYCSKIYSYVVNIYNVVIRMRR